MTNLQRLELFAAVYAFAAMVMQVGAPEPVTVDYVTDAVGAPTLAVPSVEDTEPKWSGWLAQELGGEAEHPIQDREGAGRVDILTDDLAIEVEWAKTTKAKESISQATRYALATGRKPAIVFLVGRGNVPVEKAIARTVENIAEPYIRVVWFNVQRPNESLARLRRLLDLDRPDEGG